MTLMMTVLPPTALASNRHGRRGRRPQPRQDSRAISTSTTARSGAREHRDLRFGAEPGHRLHRAVRVRQEHVPAHAQPDERPDRRHPRRRAKSCSTATTSRPGHRRRRLAAAGRHGVPEVEPVSEVDFRERGLRPARGRHGWQTRGAVRMVEESLTRAAHVGRGEGSAERIGAGAFGRAAAAAVHRAGAGRRSRRCC